MDAISPVGQGRDHADHHKKTDAMKYGNTRSHGVETEKKGGAGKANWGNEVDAQQEVPDEEEEVVAAEEQADDKKTMTLEEFEAAGNKV